ncbi:hypothetical protein [Jannaschia aquimarina]|uniref:Arginine transporter n=1 Tax=Jannaschia aquimarina TaxID=935700 RepID=A0A0D1EFC5_9RHOB|nr:hypothetical protein [Jannaschia aquimarina]KIT15596.1 hypothetical protein jaqu_26930 [Jannaschia aquimarina]SNT27469.1 hypothetical protein SAMN05421775_109147 [Jannaschia aquimarina]
MTKFLLAIGAVLAVSACGGGRSNDVTMSTISRAYSAGPLQNACLASDRRAANRALCGCVQAAANATLSRSEQVRAVRFFEDPHHAQEVRQSDRASDEVYWQRYKQFVSAAERSCRAI